MPGRIRVTGGETAGAIVEIDGELVFGRKQEGAGYLPDIETSRTHARVYVESDGGLAIEDLGSTNGTFVGGYRITGPRLLSPGDTIRMGTTTLEVEAAQVTPPPWVAVTPEKEGAGEEKEAAEEPEPELVAPESAARGGVPRPLVAVLVGVLLLAAAGIAAVLLFVDDEDDKTEPNARVQGPPALVEAASAAGCVARDLPVEGRGHTTGDVRYRTNPPTSGGHHPQAATDGAYEIPPPLTRLVHSLEHGRIVMWYRPGDNRARDMLRRVGDEDGRKMILVPNETDMPHKVAATAWGHLLGCPEINDDVPQAVREFRDAYRGKGPEAVP